MKSLYVVLGNEGEYSDRIVYVAGVFENREEACKLIAEMTAVGRANALIIEEWQKKRKELCDRAREAKITPEMRSYYAYPEGHVSLTPEEYAEINAQIGPSPSRLDYDTFDIYQVPINEWGRWE